MKNFSIKSIFARKHSDGHIHSSRDWFILLTVAVLILMLSVLWNVWLFTQLASGKALEAVKPVQQTNDTHAITDVQDVFKARATEKDNYQNTYSFIDPSQ